MSSSLPLYFATFSPGFAEVILPAFQEQYPDAEIHSFQESSCVFASTEAFQTLNHLPYFSNVFPLLREPIDITGKTTTRIVKMLHERAPYRLALQLAPDGIRPRTFRIMVQKGNQLVGITKAVMDGVKKAISSQTGLSHAPLKSDCEFWFIERNEGTAFLGIKYPGIKNAHTPNKGELQTHLAHALVLASQPEDDDVFLDPFAGSGSIPFQRAKYFPYQKMYASDNDKMIVQTLFKRLDRFENIQVQREDAGSLSSIATDSITAIVTDPPWGIYSNDVQLPIIPMYTSMLKAFARILKVDGICVVMTSKKEEFEDALIKAGSEKTTSPEKTAGAAQETVRTLILENSFSTLVNGKKASVYILRAA